MGLYRGIELDDVELASSRLLLRRWRPADAVDVQAIMTDRSMYEFLALPDPYTPEVATTFVTDIGHEGRGEGRGLGCAVVEHGSGRLVGAAALRLASEANVGYWIAPAARGHGYAAEAVRIMLDWGFGLGLHRVHLDCDVRNLASVRTAMAAGFAFEGVLRGAGATPQIDIARFARLAGEAGKPVSPAFPLLPAGGLSDGVVSVRLLQAGDAADLRESEDEVAQGWAFTHETPSAVQDARHAADSGLDWLVGRQARMAIVDVPSGRFAGTITLRSPGPPGIGAFGYGVHPAFRGRGYTSRALRLVTTWAFESAGLARLELGAKRANVASQRAALSAGFVVEAERPARLRNPDGGFGDEVIFGLVNPRYR